ncbi:outer membrane beta-barrel protein [Antarcticirhabdus aurantiaca]|uniref:Outer membrane beta-barrel protein n=1 Tax=Antarcticirhabdus aurantiaca TaxID=2606717 RepID=A0ACD4NUY3_9HYPH|nr:outer membrane beta-barrel protein [Antarcticirhabdus aurantiaca]WAJ30543.1 outer membrane beta-barrel protein [Jeongeuplla avenae]
MAGANIDGTGWRRRLGACLLAAGIAPAALAQEPPPGPVQQAPSSLANDLRPADGDFQLPRARNAPRLTQSNGSLQDEVDPMDALEAEARRTGEADDESEGGAGAAPPTRPTPSFDLFAEPERPASALDRPSAQAAPVNPEPFGAAPADARAAVGPGDATDLAGALRRGAIGPGDTATATTARAAAVRPSVRVDDARPDLFGGTPPRPTSLRNPLPATDPDDPFAAIGIRAGSFVLYPTLLQTLGASTNLEAEPDGRSGIFSETTLSARLLSDWSRHEAEANASATYRRNFQGELRDDPRVEADARLRFDLGARMGATIRGAFSYRRDDAADADDPGASGERPDAFDGTLAAELERSFGRILLRGTGSLSRSVEESAVAGIPDERYTTATAALRAGYELSPALQPFAEASLGRRLFDSSPVLGGDGPDATISALRTGTTFRLSEKLFGEAAVGYAWSDPDEGFRATRSPTFDALLTWSPRRGTDVTLTAATRFEPGSDGLSSETVYDAALGVSHRLRARIDLDGRLAGRVTDSSITGGDETLLSFEAGVTYWLSRAAALTTLYRHEDLFSDRARADWRADTIQLGIRLQR